MIHTDFNNNFSNVLITRGFFKVLKLLVGCRQDLNFSVDSTVIMAYCSPFKTTIGTQFGVYTFIMPNLEIYGFVEAPAPFMCNRIPYPQSRW